MKKIVVADDDEGILDALTLILSDAGYDVAVTTKGEETLRKVTEFEPGLILLDILMSGKDGRDICKRLKQNEKTKQIPVIMISAHPSAGDSIHECGADGFLAKPFDTSDLLSVVKKFLGE